MVQGMLEYLSPQVLSGRRKIDGRGGNVAMSHHPRQGIDIAPALHHQGRKGMPEPVHRKINLADVLELPHEPLQSGIREPLVPVEGDKELWTGLLQSVPLHKISLQGDCQSVAHRYYPVLSSLTPTDEYREVVDVHIGQLQPEELALAQSRIQEGRHDGVVPVSQEIIPVGIVERYVEQFLCVLGRYLLG